MIVASTQKPFWYGWTLYNHSLKIVRRVYLELAFAPRKGTSTRRGLSRRKALALIKSYFFLKGNG